MMHIAYIGLGSNLGDRQASINRAVDQLRQHEDVIDVRLSSLHETDPAGGPPGQGRYLNAAARIQTTLDPNALLTLMQKIEQDQGRLRQQHWGPRTIDLDLLLFDDQIINTPDLTVPHPRMCQRHFVLAPLAELAPDVVHPVAQKTIAELLTEHETQSRVSQVSHPSEPRP